MTDLRDFETELRADLAAFERSAPAPRDLTERLLTAVEQNPAPRHPARRWVWPALAAVGAVLVVLVTVLVARGGLSTDHRSAPARPLPGDFRATSVQFVDSQHGWAMGGGSCGSGGCPALARTTDGGRTWRPVPLPPGLHYDPKAVYCTRPSCVDHVAFAPDGRHGYLYSLDDAMLYVTADGGAHWSAQRSALHTTQMVVSGPNAMRVASRLNGPDRLLVAPLGSADWTDVTPWPDGVFPELAVRGETAYAFTPGSQYAWLYRSTDAGRTWTHVVSSYLRHTPATFDLGPMGSWAFSLAPDGAIAVVHLVDGRAPILRISVDGGAGFGPAHLLATSSAGASHTVRIAAASAQDLVEFEADGSSATYFRSADGGVTWHAIGHGSGPPTAPWAFPVVGFGYRLDDGSRSVSVTADAAASVVRRPLRS
jgi:photosystem II stability/assembly factor-like uncharacterized protein